jgi:hypothetical protein
MDDVTLARKVESILVREPDAPKGEVDVSAVDGVVELRGEVKHPEDVRALETKARAIPEVRDVRNLLHLPSTPSPTRTDSPESHRKRAETHRAEEHGAEVATGERTPEIAEDGPAEKAEKGEGRGPAPLGSES